jgi:hypothetical protein
MTAPVRSRNLTQRLLIPTGGLTVPYVLLLVLAPHARLTRRLMQSNALFVLLAGCYTGLFAYTLRRYPGLPGSLLRCDIAALTHFMGDPDGGVMPVWLHMTIADLFLMRWMYNESLAQGRLARLPIIVQFMVGPVGLLLYLLTRRQPTR